MLLHPIETGYFKLDGGAMFGVVPQVLWKKLNPPDNDNLCTWAMRSLLVEDGNKLILIDTGIGNKQSERFFSHYHLHGNSSLLKSINKAGYLPTDVTDVFLTHLHFDHVGGAIATTKEGSYELSFKNASYWTNEKHWDWATNPNPREKASFLAENLLPIQQSGALQYTTSSPGSGLFNNILYVDGHTQQQMLPIVHYKGSTLIFAADLIPSIWHIPLAYTMAYDMQPLVSMQEKKAVLEDAALHNHILFFQHDPVHECCTVQFSEKGVVVKEIFPLSAIL